ncbi:MAG: stage II sporulation protein P [Oscillospiraceae bacterium]
MQWTKLLRRSVAFFLAVMTLWMLTLTADLGAARESVRALGSSGVFVEAALTAELGAPPETEGALAGMSGWGRLVLEQSALLRAGKVPIDDYLRRITEEKPPAETPPTPPPTPAPTPALTGSGKGPQILIIHTHSTEAYTPDESSPYEESDSYRTTDLQHNVARVGDVLAETLGAEGFTVLHDRSLYDYPHYSGAYARSKESVARYLKEYPSISMILDVHRDALYTVEGAIDKTEAKEIAGSAQVLLVVGSNQNDAHPTFQRNLNFANALQSAMERAHPTLSRGVDLRASHYNQQLSPGFLLLEVGSHGNTLAEAEIAARLFGESIGGTLRELIFHPETEPGG